MKLRHNEIHDVLIVSALAAQTTLTFSNYPAFVFVLTGLAILKTLRIGRRAKFAAQEILLLSVLAIFLISFKENPELNAVIAACLLGAMTGHLIPNWKKVMEPYEAE